MSGEMRRMLSGTGFRLAVPAAMLVIMLGVSWPEKTDALLLAGSFLELPKEALCSKTVCFLLPAIAVLPWSDSFLSEWKSGFLKFCLPRTGRHAYAESKLLAVALGGFLTWVAAGLLLLFFSFVFLFPFEEKGSLALEPFCDYVLLLLRCALISGSISSFGSLAGALTGSLYLAYGLPFVAWYFCIILQERYFPEALWLYPPEWIAGKADWGGRGEGLWLFLILLFFISALLDGFAIYEKMKDF